MRIGRRAKEKTVSFAITLPESDYQALQEKWHGKNRSQVIRELLKEGLKHASIE